MRGGRDGRDGAGGGGGDVDVGGGGGGGDGEGDGGEGGGAGDGGGDACEGDAVLRVAAMAVRDEREGGGDKSGIGDDRASGGSGGGGGDGESDECGVKAREASEVAVAMARVAKAVLVAVAVMEETGARLLLLLLSWLMFCIGCGCDRCGCSDRLILSAALQTTAPLKASCKLRRATEPSNRRRSRCERH